MLPTALGIITSTTPGTPVRLATPTDSTNHYPQPADLWANRVVLAAPIAAGALTGNVGPVYIGVAGMVKETGAGVLAILLGGDSTAVTFQSWGNKIWVPGLFVDVDNSGDGILAYAETD